MECDDIIQQSTKFAYWESKLKEKSETYSTIFKYKSREKNNSANKFNYGKISIQ